MPDTPSFTAQALTIKIDAPHELQADGAAVLDRLARLVGFTAIGLPILLAVGTVIAAGCFRDSISHFYHTQFMGGVFVGLLFFIGGFMIAYTGASWLERVGSTIAGLCAFGVALFPTAGSGCEGQETFLSRVFVEVTQAPAGGPPYTFGQGDVFGQSYFSLFGAASEYHMAFAGAVFVYLGLFCLFVLRRVIPAKHGEGPSMIATKRRRNTLYFWCGVVILVCVGVLALKGRLVGDLTSWDALNLTFWVEAVALWAFGLAWITKGRIFKALND
ncbi:MAG: hypothetical protein AAGM84_07785 [Pseudomonadota bacterium]